MDSRTRPVGSFQPNRFGLHHGHGDVWEWVKDTEGSKRALRGGSWYSGPQAPRAARRNRRYPTVRLNDVGVRLARDLEGEKKLL
ncbi:MAG: formylglycine-generating enzyme family protein [Caulobacterales bacterium]